MKFFVESLENETRNGIEYRVSKLFAPVFKEGEEPNGAGYVTREDKGTTTFVVKVFTVALDDNGVPSVSEQDDLFNMPTNVAQDAEKKAAWFGKRYNGVAYKVISESVSAAGIVGLPVEIFNTLGVKIVRPESQRK